jgi:hypothetical protein
MREVRSARVTQTGDCFFGPTGLRYRGMRSMESPSSPLANDGFAGVSHSRAPQGVRAVSGLVTVFTKSKSDNFLGISHEPIADLTLL